MGEKKNSRIFIASHAGEVGSRSLPRIELFGSPLVLKQESYC